MVKKWKGYRIFGGLKYEYMTSFPHKSDALSLKKRRKAKGDLIRIVKERKPLEKKAEYSVYKR